MLRALSDRVASGGSPLTRAEGLSLASAPLADLFAGASALRERFRGRAADLCSIISAKTGACPEDCTYCAQGTRSKAAHIQIEPLLPVSTVAERARAARASGARRFCIVTSGRGTRGAELDGVARMVGAVADLGLLPCATLGLLTAGELRMLKSAGLHRYHHNLETSRAHFPEICSTHTFDQKLATIHAAKDAGLSVCSGGIFGLGETWADRMDMALDLRELGVDSVPVNFLVPVEGTPLGGRPAMDPLEALRVVSVMRFMLPHAEVRICGGRLQTLGEFNSMVFLAGADGLLTGDCLTVAGRDPGDDLKLIAAWGMEVAEP
jgi:biotin synthase